MDKFEKIDQMVEELYKIKDGNILSELNKMGVSVDFLPEGIRWRIQ